MIADRLRKSILQAAIGGKLTNQSNGDSDIKKHISNFTFSQNRLVKKNEIKEKDVPFKIPDNWIWTKLGSIGESNIGLTYKPENIKQEGALVLRSSNIQNGFLDYNDNVFVDVEIPDNKKASVNDILICARNGSKRLVGKAAIVDKEGMSFGAFMSIYRTEFYKYVYYYLQTPYFRQDFDGVSTTTINQITQGNLLNRLIPLPPIEEQVRIIDRLETILPIIDKLAEDENKLSKQYDEFPEKLKRSILLAAIEGKVTNSFTTKEEVHKLRGSILLEKNNLVKNNLIRKEKKYPVDEESEINIPDKWERLELMDIIHFAKPNKRKFDKEKIYLDVKSMREEDYTKTRKSGELVYPGDLAILVDGQNSGEVFEIKIEGILGSTLRKIVINPKIYREYALLILEFYKVKFRDNKRGSAIPHLDFQIFNTSIVPLPSYSEQVEIVKKVNNILSVKIF